MGFWSSKTTEPAEDSKELRSAKENLAQELVTLRIVTIRSDSASGSRAGQSVGDKLLDLSNLYKEYLNERAHGLEGARMVTSTERSPDGERQSFGSIRDRAQALAGEVRAVRKGKAASSQEGAEAGEAVARLRSAADLKARLAIEEEVLQRISRYAGDLAKALDAQASSGTEDAERAEVKLDSSAMQLLHGALEMGVDHVAMQTTVSLMGDITTRISPHIPESEVALYLAMHEAGMRASLSHWQNLVNTMVTFVDNLMGLLVKPGS